MSVRKDKSLLQAAKGIQQTVITLERSITPFASVQKEFAKLQQQTKDLIILAERAEGVEDETRETHLR